MDRYFNLFSYCIPVRGCNRGVVCDLIRNMIQPVSLSVMDYLSATEPYLTLEEWSKDRTPLEIREVNEQINHLFQSEFGYFSNHPILPRQFSLDASDDESQITNAIVDLDVFSTHTLIELVPQLKELGCKALEVRIFYSLSFESLQELLHPLIDSGFEYIEVLVEHHPETKNDAYEILQHQIPGLRKITVSRANENTIYHRDSFILMYTTELIRNEAKCGVTGELYCVANVQLYQESLKHNNCLYKKISVDKYGYIKNCPSMNQSFGEVHSTRLMDALNHSKFRDYWHITKDQINVCKQCELRYVCQDCRAYRMDMDDIYSKPMKCRYNPLK